MDNQAIKDKINGLQQEFITTLAAHPLFVERTRDDVEHIVFTIGRTYAAGQALLEVVPFPVMPPEEGRVVRAVILRNTADIADLLYRLYVPAAYAPDLSDEEATVYGTQLADITDQIIALAKRCAECWSEEQGGTSQIVLPH